MEFVSIGDKVVFQMKTSFARYELKISNPEQCAAANEMIANDEALFTILKTPPTEQVKAD